MTRRVAVADHDQALPRRVTEPDDWIAGQRLVGAKRWPAGAAPLQFDWSADRVGADWQRFCQLRQGSTLYRAVDDPAVALAYSDWLASYLTEGDFPSATNIIPFRTRTMRP